MQILSERGDIFTNKWSLEMTDPVSDSSQGQSVAELHRSQRADIEAA